MRKRLLRGLLLLTVCQAAVLGQKKPVTLAALNEWRDAARRGAPGDPVWAPDGKTFIFEQARKLKLYDLATKSTRDVADLQEMDAAAVDPPLPERFDWENRRVDDTRLQWNPQGREVLYLTGGDLFIIEVKGGEVPGGKWRQATRTPVAERDPKFSPDGKHISFRRDWDLYVLDAATGRETRLTRDGSDTRRNGGLDWVYPEELDLGTAYWWSPDSAAIAYLQFNIDKEPLYPHEDLSGARPVFEPQRYPQAGDPNPEVHLGVVAAAGGNTRWLDAGDTANSFLIARAGWTADAGRVYVARTNRVQNAIDFLVFDIKNGESRSVYRETDPFWINVEGSPVFLKDGKRFVWTSERDGFRHLYLYSLHGEQPKQLTRGAWEVTDLYGVNETTGRVYYRSSEGNPLERQLYSVALDGGEKRQLTKGAGTHRISIARVPGAFLDIYSNLTSPPEATLRTSEGEAIAVYRPADRRALEELDLRPTEIVELKGKSGVTLYATLIKPAGFDPAKKYPVLVNVYGGPHAQGVRNAWPGVGIDQVYAQKGYLVWQLDNRGTSGRGHAFETPVFRNLGAVELADQREGIEHLISTGFADAARVGVTGWSYGGFMILDMLLNAPDMVRAGFAGAPVTNWLNYDTIYTERYMGLPKENETAYAATSLAPKAANLKGRLMIAHNVEDDNVLFQNTLQMIKALESAGKQFELALYPQKTHGVGGAAARQMEAAMLDFFDRSLAPGARPTVPR